MYVSLQALDGIYGKPAAGLHARLERSVEGRWSTVANAATVENGTIASFVEGQLAPGLYRVVVDSDLYFSGLGFSAAYAEIVIPFRVRAEPYARQVQVLLTPYSYSLYFGDRA
ncbi:hydroxyisourate hydrolase [Couchioplanes caeruleus]|uniref:5-hydroxyisourate hydrolase n=1 Tax=Couchioplanes caeruleus TaxID=56438 RepID=A0A3N1GM49_9ACTN|nr:hydroxyisourate hydrolase [Couchioplanes caeruleus]ROP31337.1 5-hydroxyisourate hydrolase [Couchioplanes caeruleus]